MGFIINPYSRGCIGVWYVVNGLLCKACLEIDIIQVTILASACAAATLHPKLRTPPFRVYRASMYASLGISAIVFIVHGLSLHGWEVQNQRMSLDWMLWMACLNLLEAAAYGSRVSPSCLYCLRMYSVSSSSIDP